MLRAFRILLIALIMTMLPASRTAAQAPDTLWTRIFGYEGGDLGYSVGQTLDGGYIIAGSAQQYVPGGYDIYIIRADYSGHMVWYRTFGAFQEFDIAYSVQQAFDGGFICAGEAYNNEARGFDMDLRWTESAGHIGWHRAFGGPGKQAGYALQQTRDGGYIVAGYTRPPGTAEQDAFVVKTDSQGDSLWSTTFGTEFEDEIWSINQTWPDGGYIMAGYTRLPPYHGWMFLLARMDASGDTLWTRTFEDARQYGLHIKKIWAEQTVDGGYILAGATNTRSATGVDAVVIKVDADGDLLWRKTYGGEGDDCASEIHQTPDGGFIVVGSTEPPGGGDTDVYVMRLDADGDSIWTATYGGSGYDFGLSIRQTSDGGYIIAGSSASFGTQSRDVCLIKTAPESGMTYPLRFRVSEPRPNPCSRVVTFSIDLSEREDVTIDFYDVRGRMLGFPVRTTVGQGQRDLTLDLESLPQPVTSGVYFCRLAARNHTATRKVIMLRQ
jgi:hypothetical protein